MLKTEMNQNEVAALRKMDNSNSSQSSSLLSSPFGEASSSMPMPDAPKGGLVVKINYAGACYSERASRRKRYTARFPGDEVAGTIQEVSKDLPNCTLSAGDRVLVVPDEDSMDGGIAEYVPVSEPSKVIPIPNNVPTEVAAMLPGGALTALSAVTCAKPHVEKLRQVKSCVNVLVVSAGHLGQWTLRVAQYVMGSDCSNVRMYVADSSIDRLLAAQDTGCADIIHWNEEDHEQYIVERTLDCCRGGVDIIIDFVGTHRSMQRSLKVLNREGLILVGGNSTCETNISLNALAAKQQSIVGIPKGNVNQLHELLNAVKNGDLQAPSYEVFPIEDANRVFEDLCECRVTSRAVFKFGSQLNTQSVVDNQ